MKLEQPIRGDLLTLPPTLAFVMQCKRAHRSAIDVVLEQAIAELDLLDGDPDLEGECSEDEISRCDDMGRPVRGNGPGCDIADAGGIFDEDGINTGPRNISFLGESGPGCPISDPGGYDDGF